MKLSGNASGLGSFFMRFGGCITLYRAGCEGGWAIGGKYEESKRKPVQTSGLITDVKTKTVQDASGERIEGTLNFRVQGVVYSSSEDDIGAADIIHHDGRYWKVLSADKIGCDTSGSAVLLSDDQCLDHGVGC